jgi:hypothetical protein
MATGTANEEEYARFFNSFYSEVKKTNPTGRGVTVVFQDTLGKKVVLPMVTAIRRIGGKGKKPDLNVYTNNRIFKISIKDNTSIYWGSEDRYIRERYAQIILEYVKRLTDDEVVIYDERQRKYILKGKLALRIDTRAKNKTVFGSESRTGDNNCDIVIRGEIKEKDVERDVASNTIMFNVKRIYSQLRDIPEREEPVLFIYNEGGARPRSTFNTKNSDIEEEARVPITELPGIRGSFRSRENAEYEIEIRKNGLWLM